MDQMNQNTMQNTMYLLNASPIKVFEQFVLSEITFLKFLIENIKETDNFIRNKCKATFESSLQERIQEYNEYENYKKKLLIYTGKDNMNMVASTILLANKYLLDPYTSIKLNVDAILQKCILNDYIKIENNPPRNFIPINLRWDNLHGNNINNSIKMIESTINNINTISNIYISIYNKSMNYVSN